MSDVKARRVTTRHDRKEFIDFAKRLYAANTQWVPPMDADLRSFMKRSHPYFEESEAEFLLFTRGARTVARAAVMNNHRYNREHGVRTAHFYFVDFEDLPAASECLFETLREWAGEHGLESLTGPLFSGGTMGGGVLVEGFEHRAAMTMMPYNFKYYENHFERAGFAKFFDLFSLRTNPAAFKMPARVTTVAEKVEARGRFNVLPLKTRRELKAVADEIGALYNPTLADHSENYPLTNREIEQLKKDLLVIARPDLEKIIRYDGQLVGFILSFPDLSAVLQKNAGKLGPRAILRLLRGRNRTDKILFNGMGILEKHQRLGGNALLYSELAKSVTTGEFTDCEMVQINEETVLMLSDLQTLGAIPFKRHRVYRHTWN